MNKELTVKELKERELAFEIFKYLDTKEVIKNLRLSSYEFCGQQAYSLLFDFKVYSVEMQTDLLCNMEREVETLRDYMVDWDAFWDVMCEDLEHLYEK